MQNYSTIIGVIELRQQNVGYATTQKRYGILTYILPKLSNTT